MSAGLEIQLIAILVAGACSILGVFLVLKSMAMVSDAITPAKIGRASCRERV